MSQAGLCQGRTAALFLTIALSGFSANVSAQEIRVLSEEVHQFDSPMVLEMSLDPILDRPVGEKWSTDKTKWFLCRGVSIESLEFTVQPESKKFPANVEIRALLTNNSGKDKQAVIRYEAVDGDKLVCMAVGLANVEQGDKASSSRADLYLRPPERWTHLPRPKLRVVLTLQNY